MTEAAIPPKKKSVLDTMVGAGGSAFLAKPHDRLYPCLFEGDQMREEARQGLVGHMLPVLESSSPGAREWVRFAVIGSGMSYNWDDRGDLDVQVWVDVDTYASSGKTDPENLVKRLRRESAPANFPRLADIGLATDDCDGKMLVQYYIKPGKGTHDEVRSERPYAAYDLDGGEWIVQPEPITPEFYATLFMAVEKKAERLAEQAGDLFDDLERRTAEATYWDGLLQQDPKPTYEEQRDEARLAAEQARAGVVTIFDAVFEGRDEAYGPGGKGIKDERDATEKLLEVWGVFQKLKHHARDPLPWEEISES